MTLKLKMKRITTADLIINGLPVPIVSIELDSTELSKEELMDEISRQFRKMIIIKYHEKWVKK